MNNKDSLNSQDSAFIHKLNRASIISLLGSFQKRLDNCEKILQSKQSSYALIMTFIAAQFISLIILNIMILQIQRKISIIQISPSIHEVR